MCVSLAYTAESITECYTRSEALGLEPKDMLSAANAVRITATSTLNDSLPSIAAVTTSRSAAAGSSSSRSSGGAAQQQTMLVEADDAGADDDDEAVELDVDDRGDAR